MKYGYCHLSLAPLRKENNHRSELISQFLFGDCFKVIKQKGEWLLVSGLLDQYEGWIEIKQQSEISENEALSNTKNPKFSFDLVHYVSNQSSLIPILLGSNLATNSLFDIHYDGQLVPSKKEKEMLTEFAMLYLHAPYLWGGKTPFGIDCSGLVQMVYRLQGIFLPRDAAQQAEVGTTLSFVEESEPGDLAFFDDEHGTIVHVGILLKNHHIIHAHGSVRIDRIDQTGIYNSTLNKHSHKLRLIKRII